MRISLGNGYSYPTFWPVPLALIESGVVRTSEAGEVAFEAAASTSKRNEDLAFNQTLKSFSLFL